MGILVCAGSYTGSFQLFPVARELAVGLLFICGFYFVQVCSLHLHLAEFLS